VRVLEPAQAPDLVFDHAQIIDDYRSAAEIGFSPPFVR
jgi:hypothetical protein